MTFQEAIGQMEKGKRLTREYWKHEKLDTHFIMYIKGKVLSPHSAEKIEDTKKVSTHLAGYFGVDTRVLINPYMVMCSKVKDRGIMTVGWNPAGEDIMAYDWEVME